MRNGSGIGLEIFQLLRVMLILTVISLNLSLKVINLVGIFYALHKAVLIQHTHDECAQDNNNMELEPTEKAVNMSGNLAHFSVFLSVKIKQAGQRVLFQICQAQLISCKSKEKIADVRMKHLYFWQINNLILSLFTLFP